MAPKYLTENDFQNNTIGYPNLAIVECYDSTSSELEIMQPVILKLKKKYGNMIVHLRIDINTNTSLIQSFYIIHEPTYLLFLDGILIDKIEGFIPFNEFAKIIDNHTQEQNCKTNNIS